MSVRCLLAVTCLLAPLLASGATLDTYAELTSKTILAPSALPSLPDSIVSELAPEKTNAIASIEREFSKRGIYVVQDGPSFMRLLPTERWQAYLTNAPLRGVQLGTAARQELSPAGMVNFPRTELSQVLVFYAELKKRTILRTRFLPPALVCLKTQRALTREELIYAVETVLALEGIATVDDGEAFVQIVPMSLRSKVNAHAPARDASARLFNPAKVPAMGQYDLPRPQTKVERDLERWRKEFFEFIRLNSAHNSSAQRLLELYAGLTDKRAEPSAEFESSLIWFHVTTPVSKSELIYAIETTFALSHLAIRKVDDETIRLDENEGPGKDVGRQGAPLELNLVITNLVVTPSEVDPKSVKLTAVESPQPNLIFNYVGKTPEQVRAIHRSHAPVLVVKHGVVFAKAPACAGHKSRIGPDGHGDFDGLVLIFDDLNQARIAERVLKREDKKPQ